MDDLTRRGEEVEEQTRRKLRLTAPSENEQNASSGSIRIRGRRGGENVSLAENNLPGFVVKQWRAAAGETGLPNPPATAPPAPRQRVSIRRSWSDRLSGALGRFTQGGTDSAPRPRMVLRVQRGWQEHGWRKDEDWNLGGEKFVGEYRTDNRSWEGYALTPATRNSRGDFDFYIYRPPNGVSRHPCWHHAGEGWYWVNYSTPPPDLLSGIKHIENFLAEVS